MRRGPTGTDSRTLSVGTGNYVAGRSAGNENQALSAMTLKIKFKLICFPFLIGLRQVKRFFEKLHTLTMLSILSIS